MIPMRHALDGANIERIEEFGRDFKPAPSKPRPHFHSAADWQGLPIPSREWLVQWLIPQRTVTLLSGDGGTGKSLLAAQLAVAVASGGTFLGMPVRKGGVIYLSAEDDLDELHRRTDDIIHSTGQHFRDLWGLTFLPLVGEDAHLATDAESALKASALFRELASQAAQEKPALIVIDTLADVYPSDENNRMKARQFIGLLNGLALRHRCAVLVLAHPSLTGLNSGSGTSGSTAWSNSVRSRLYLTRDVVSNFEADPDKRVLTTKKANYGRAGGEITLKWQKGVFVVEAAPSPADATAASAKAQQVFLKLLDEFTNQGRKVNHSGGTNYAPKQFADCGDAERVTKEGFKKAMGALLRKGEIRVEEEGPPSRRVTRLVRVRR